MAVRPWFRQRAAASPIAELTRPPDGLAGVLFEQPDLGLVAIDRSGGIVRANAAMRGLAGPLANLARGAAVTALFAATERAAAGEALRACLRGQVLPDFATLLHGGASVGVSAVALRDAAGVCGALLRLSDLSGRRVLEAQLAHAQRMQTVGQLAGGVAHDFNNLLSAVLGAAESVAGSILTPEAAADVAEIRSSAGRGAALVRQLLAFGRPQTARLQTLAVADMVAGLAGLLRRVLGSQVRLDVDLAEPGGQVCADRTQLEQVLVNLAVNARDAMPDGGTLTLRTGQLTVHHVQTDGAETIPPGRYAMIEVQDSGTGIGPDVLQHIFEPFFTTRRERGGSGLGLSMAAGIIRQSAGFIDVESAPGIGTRMRVYLPQADDQALSIPDARQRPVLPLIAAMRHGSVLVVDDEEPVRRLAERALARAGWHVIAAASGEQALAALAAPEATTCPRLVGLVSDLAMPGMDGVELLCAVRAQTGQPELPTLLVSGYAEAALCEALAGHRRVAFLAKPYGLAELVDAFAELVAGAPDLACGTAIGRAEGVPEDPAAGLC